MQGYWCILSHTHRRTSRREEGRPSLFFLKIERSVLILEKKPCLYSSLGWLFHSKCTNFSRRNTFKMFPWRASFSCVFTKCLSKCLSSTNHPLSCPERFLVGNVPSSIILFAKRSLLIFDSVLNTSLPR